MKNIDSAFKYVRGFSLVIIVGSIAVSCFALYKSYALVASVHSKIYILANGKALEAYASDRKDNIPVEAKDHISTFHRHFFSLEPDEKLIQSNLTKSMYLADASAKVAYDNLKESGYFSNVISGNMSQQVVIDSILLNLNMSPIYFRCYGTQKIIRTSSIAWRSLITEGYLRNVSRSENNSHGFLIERWSVLENKDLKIEKR